MKKVLLLATPLLWFNQSVGQCTDPVSVTATPSVFCAGATTSLNATAPGLSINWYTVAVGGVPLGTSASGANFPVSPVNTTTYYAESFASGSYTFNYTGGVQTFTVPLGVTQITLDTYGAQGQGPNGGLGGRAQGVMNVTPGQVLNIYVGGQAGYNGGGIGWSATSKNGGGGSDVRVSPYALANRVVVAGGGGGGGPTDVGTHVGGAGGGGVVGANYVGGGGGGGYGGAGGNGGLSGGAGNTSCHSGGGGGGGFNNGGGGSCNNCYGNSCGQNGTLGQGGNGDTWENGICYNTYGGTSGGGGGYYGGGGTSVGNCGGGAGGGGSSFTGTLANPLFQAGVQNGNGKVIVYASACTSASRTAVQVTVNPNPVITVNSGSICMGNSFTINPSGANTYTIQGGSAVVSPTTNTNYTVIGTSTAGCVSQVAVTSSVTVNASPLPTITVNSGSICSGKSFTLNPSGANTYTIQGGSAVVSPTSNASYTVVGTNTAGCVSNTFAVANITVQALPTVSVAGTPTVCKGATVSFTANGANTYSWSTGASTSTLALSPTVTTSYTVTGTSAQGCSSTYTFALLVDPCTGIAESSNVFAGLLVYPNPSNGDFAIELKNGAVKTITITDVTGKVVLSTSTSKDVADISLTQFESGIYNVKIESNNASQVIRIVKQ